MSCPDAGLCTKLKRHIHGRLWDIWQGKVLTPEQCQAYREKWIAEAGLQPQDLPPKKEDKPNAAPNFPAMRKTDPPRKPCGCRKKP